MKICYGVIIFNGSDEELDFIRKLSALASKIYWAEVKIHISVHNKELLTLFSHGIVHEDITFNIDTNNSGYAGGYNKTIQFSEFFGADLAFFSNTDIEFDDFDFICWLNEIMQENCYIAPVQKLPSGSYIYGSKFGVFPITSPVKKRHNNIDSALGAIMYSKKDQFILRMNEAYFMYNEEHEFFYNLKKVLSIIPSKKFTFQHQGAQSSSPKYRLLMIRRNLRLLSNTIHKNTFKRTLSFLTNYISLTFKIFLNKLLWNRT